METKVVVEQPLFTLNYSDYNTSASLDVYSNMLRKASVGAVLMPAVYNSCGRDITSESLEVVYRNDEGCACLYRRKGTTDSPNAEPWEDEPQLIWFELSSKAWMEHDREASHV